MVQEAPIVFRYHVSLRVGVRARDEDRCVIILEDREGIFSVREREVAEVWEGRGGCESRDWREGRGGSVFRLGVLRVEEERVDEEREEVEERECVGCEMEECV